MGGREAGVYPLLPRIGVTAIYQLWVRVQQGYTGSVSQPIVEIHYR